MPNFKDIIGHDAIAQRLRAAAQSEEVCHAYLFTGPEGVGKTTTALALARLMNCSAPVDDSGALDSCGQCPSCRQIDVGSHPDVHLVRPVLSVAETVGDFKGSSEILIGQVRELIRMLSLTPSSGKRKVFIVAPADAMNTQAQNALLKSLEEPPRLSNLILCAESADSLLPTIRSRCQLVSFGLAPKDVVEKAIREGFGLTEEEARMVAAASQGKVGDAIRYARDEALRQARWQLVKAIVEAISGSALSALQATTGLRESAAQVPIRVENRGTGDMDDVIKTVAARLQLQLLLEEFGGVVRDLLALKVSRGQDTSNLLINVSMAAELQSMADSRSEASLLSAMDSVLTAQDLLRRNVNPQLLLDDLLLQLCV